MPPAPRRRTRRMLGVIVIPACSSLIALAAREGPASPHATLSFDRCGATRPCPQNGGHDPCSRAWPTLPPLPPRPPLAGRIVVGIRLFFEQHRPQLFGD